MEKKDLINRIILFLILVLAFVLRISNLDKPFGLWLDEIITYVTANRESFLDIVRFSMSHDIHAPFYYVLLHFWMEIFGEHDIILRFFSVIWGVLTVLTAYFLGKELDGRKTGLLASFLCAINSFLIYYSQEVRIYSLTAFLAIAALLFAVKSAKNLSIRNLTGFVLINLMLLYTHTIAVVFVGIEAMVFGGYLYLKKKDGLKKYVFFNLILFILSIPYLFTFFNRVKSPLVGIIGQWWCNVNISKPLLSLGDMFSPLLINIYGTDSPYLGYLFNDSGLNVVFVIFSVVPVIIVLAGIINALRSRDASTNMVFLVCAGFLAVFTAAYVMEKVLFLTRYIIEVLPPLLVVAACGLMKIRNSRVLSGLITVYAFITLVSNLYLDLPAFNDSRISGHKTPADILKQYDLGQNDLVVSIFYAPEWFYKYYPEGQGASFRSVNWQTLAGFLEEGGTTSLLLDADRLNRLIRDFISGKTSGHYKNRVQNEFIAPLEEGNYLVILTDQRFHSYTLEQLDGKTPKKTNMPLMLYSRFTEDLLKICEKQLKFIKKEEKNEWELYFYRY